MHVLYDVIPEKISKHFECKALLVGVSFVSVTIYAAVYFLRCMLLLLLLVIMWYVA